MNLKELDSFKLSDAVVFHDHLNPDLWRNGHLLPEVKNQLEIIAEDFLQELGISGLKVKDITVSGSNAAYSYTPHSDLDLHILVDMSKLSNDEIYKELFNAKKTLYNDTHDIKVHGVPVELYVQDSNQPVVSIGEYSLLNDKWLRVPVKRRANFDQNSSAAKYEKLANLIELGLKSRDIEKVDHLLKTIKRYRQAGLDKGGEFGPENLAFKALRSQGYIDKLYKLRNKLHSEELTIEDYDPNGPPPGPEFKPTMPRGTARVDVSDVYDWYKLGQHISNLKGLGKHDFGKGPPSTIISFGSEDEEHKYIKDLEKTGLTTTDIDPASHKKMKGQKVDPTYNVNENDVEENMTMVRVPDIKVGTIVRHNFLPKGGIVQKVDDSRVIVKALHDNKLYSFDVASLNKPVHEDNPLRFAAEKTPEVNPYGGLRDTQFRGGIAEASGYIPSEKEKNDPRFKTALTVDVKPDSIKKNAKAFAWLTNRAGIPPTAKANGKF